MKKLLRLLFILLLLGLGFLYIVKNPELGISQTILKAIGMEKLLIGQNVDIANPASLYCEQQSGTIEIVTDASGAQSGICHLTGGIDCDEWAYFRGECPGTGTEFTGTVENSGLIDQNATESNYEGSSVVEANISKDQNGVSVDGDKVIGADSATFRFFTKKDCFIYYIDKNNVYINGPSCEFGAIKIDGADPTTFQTLDIPGVSGEGEQCFSKDKDNMYCGLQKIDGADPTTFKKIAVRYYQDKNSMYYNRGEFIKIEGSDPTSFEILDGYYAKDKNNVYFEGKQIIGADPDTFGDICRDGGARDKNNVYSNGKILPGADPQKYGCGA